MLSRDRARHSLRLKGDTAGIGAGKLCFTASFDFQRRVNILLVLAKKRLDGRPEAPCRLIVALSPQPRDPSGVIRSRTRTSELMG
jgi:hypothetical protein